MINPFQSLRESMRQRLGWSEAPNLHRQPERLREDGLIAGTQVSSLDGWRPVETILPGDVVITFDHALQPVVNTHTLTIDPERLPAHKRFLLVVPPRVLGNRSEITMLSAQEVLLETDFAESVYGDPFTLVPMHKLEGHGGITRRNIDAPLTLHMLTFAREQVILAEGMTLAVCRDEMDFSPFSAAQRLRNPEYARLSSDALDDIVAAWAAEAGHLPKRKQPAPSDYAAFSPARV